MLGCGPYTIWGLRFGHNYVQPHTKMGLLSYAAKFSSEAMLYTNETTELHIFMANGEAPD